jgi:rhodanese-related sulfurtransferase
MKFFPVIFSALLVFATLFSCQNPVGNKSTEIELLEPEVFVSSFEAEPEALLIDCRTPREVSRGALKGAINLDYRSPIFDAEAEKLDKDLPVYIYCQGGGRSSAAAEKLKMMGFEEIHDMRGGYGSLPH